MENQATASSRSTQERTGSSTGSVELGLKAGQVIQEFYWDDDVDESFRARIEEATGVELVDEDYADVCDGTLIWWRDDDGDADDLADLLVDARANLDDGSGIIWVMIPSMGSVGYVEHNVVEEAAQTAGLAATTAAALSRKWTGVRLTARGPRR
ncbi:DUF3052 domain-containing protein [Flaviflexus sp. JY899]|uniref:DUF3052 domain-containing protein n=1 Tax=Flaviflexus equikiangi TaxID=2758573 RepID=A0ABS2TEX9_9ACTO|nr:DUF3052 domain-containing protein [Flaviflexus equikiangi]